MATNNIPVEKTDGWKSVVFSKASNAGGYVIEICSADARPDNSFRGHPLNPGERMDASELSAGTIYALVRDVSSILVTEP